VDETAAVRYMTIDYTVRAGIAIGLGLHHSNNVDERSMHVGLGGYMHSLSAF